MRGEAEIATAIKCIRTHQHFLNLQRRVVIQSVRLAVIVGTGESCAQESEATKRLSEGENV
jgi:hypothetical protein